MVALPLWGSVTSLLPPHLSPRPLLDGIFRRDRRRLLGKSGKLLACSLHLWDLSRPSSPECPFFASPALSLSWVHCGLSSVAQVSLWDKVRYQLSEKGERCSPVTGCFFPEVVSLDLEHHVFWPWGNAVNYQEHNLFDLDSLKKKNHCKDGSFSLNLSSVNGPSLIIYALFRSGVSYLDAFENWLRVSWWGWGFSLAVWSNQSSEGEYDDTAAGRVWISLLCTTADSSRALSTCR